MGALNSFAQLRNSRFSDAFLALFVIAIALLLLVPIPTQIIDLLIAFNISFAVLLLLMGLYMPNALALLAFPTLLLLTTLFRLGLNVASTRLILSQGFAGEVISAFGGFLIQDEIIVGLIIFAIITVVNFIVITRGASRVSEVAARFSLEALPGKQMAIDSDLRSGLLTAEEAQQKREDLRKESQLYGAMDGAMKFVQGDVIAGVFIVFVNILGGMYLGMRGGLSLQDAINTYTKLTVGDGLVTQIPALLISICAGIVVTRISAGKHSTLGSDLKAQIFTNPGLLILTGLIAGGVAMLGSIPTLPFLTVGLVLIAGGGWLLRKSRYGLITEEGFDTGGAAGAESRAVLGQLGTGESKIVVHLDAGPLYRTYQAGAVNYRQWWQSVQRDCFEEHGLSLPPAGVTADATLAPNHYRVFINGVAAFQGVVPRDALLVEVNPENASVLGLELVETAEHPLSGSRIFWTAPTAAFRRITEASEMRSFDVVEYILLRAAAFMQAHPEEAVSLAEVHVLLKQVEKKYPGLALENVAGDFISVARLTEILQELVRQGMSIRDIKQVLEAVASYCATYGVSMVQQGDFDLQDIVGFIRMNRKRHMLAKLLSERGTLKVVTLSEEVEAWLQEVSIEDSSFPLAVEPSQFEKMKEGLFYVLDPVRNRGVLPVSVLCRADLRTKVLAFLRASNRSLGVVAFEELDPLITVEPAGVWSV